MKFNKTMPGSLAFKLLNFSFSRFGDLVSHRAGAVFALATALLVALFEKVSCGASALTVYGGLRAEETEMN